MMIFEWQWQIVGMQLLLLHGQLILHTIDLAPFVSIGQYYYMYVQYRKKVILVWGASCCEKLITYLRREIENKRKRSGKIDLMLVCPTDWYKLRIYLRIHVHICQLYAANLLLARIESKKTKWGKLDVVRTSCQARRLNEMFPLQLHAHIYHLYQI